jgi:DeoR/GlpR family transcriptional regulator of sugar metabolism
VAFIGVHAIHNSIPTETSLEVAAMKLAMISSARRVVLLADASKFQLAAFCRICHPAAVHEVITDDRANEADIANLRNAGIAVTVVQPCCEKTG